MQMIEAPRELGRHGPGGIPVREVTRCSGDFRAVAQPIRAKIVTETQSWSKLRFRHFDTWLRDGLTPLRGLRQTLGAGVCPKE